MLAAPVNRLSSAPAGAGVSTAELLVRVAERDQAAFAQLYAVQLPMVRDFAFRLLHDFHQAEEVAQEVLLQVWQIASRFDPARGSAAAWIIQISRGRTIDRIRSSQASRIREARHAQLQIPCDFDAVVETFSDRLDASLVRTGLLAATALQREALVLAFYTDQTYAEIAATLQIPLGTVKTRIRDGLGRVRQSLACQDNQVSDAA